MTSQQTTSPGPQKLYAAALLDNLHNDVFFRNYVFDVVFSFATRYGFQVFNPNPLLAVQIRDAALQAGFQAMDGRPPHVLELQQAQHGPALQAALQEINTRRGEEPEWGRSPKGGVGSSKELKVAAEGKGLRTGSESINTPGRRGVTTFHTSHTMTGGSPALTGGSLAEGESPGKGGRGGEHGSGAALVEGFIGASATDESELIVGSGAYRMPWGTDAPGGGFAPAPAGSIAGSVFPPGYPGTTRSGGFLQSESQGGLTPGGQGELSPGSNPRLTPEVSPSQANSGLTPSQLGVVSDSVTSSAAAAVDAPYVGSSVFVAADHLCRVLVDDLMVRNCCINGVDLHTAFAEAVWILHSKLLAAYTKWCEQVMQVPVRPTADIIALSDRGHTDETVLRMLLAELALFMLMYTESANVRHLTDGLSFLFWVARFSPDFMDALNTCPLITVADVCNVEFSLRDAVLLFRNRAAADLDAAATALRQGMVAPEDSPENQFALSCFIRFQQQLHGSHRKSPLRMVVEGMYAWEESSGFDTHVVAWVFAISEERPFLEEIVQPMFHFMAYLEDKLGRAGWETSARLCYEDFNDSLCHPHIVHNTLALLGVTDTAQYNPAYSTLCGIGRRPEGGVDLDRVSVWWEAVVVRKMFSERRGYLRVFRDYFYGHLIPILLFHALLNFFFTAGSVSPHNICHSTSQPATPSALSRSNCFNLIPVVWTALVVTHTVMLALRDVAAVWLARQPRCAPTFASFVGLDPASVNLLPSSVHIDPSSDSSPNTTPVASTSLSPSLFSLSPASPNGVSVPLIGSVPLLALPSLLRAAIIVTVFFGQFQPGSVGSVLHILWYPLAAVYFCAAVFAHFVSTQDGYTGLPAGLHRLKWLFSLFQPNTQRNGDPDPSVLRVGRKSHKRTMLLWTITLPVAFLAAFLVGYSLMLEMQLLLDGYNVFERGSWKLGAYDTGLPVPGKALAVVIMMLGVVLGMAFGLTFFTLLMFGSQVMTYLFAKRHGFGQLKNWATLCEQFDTAAALWCRRCMHRTDSSRPSTDIDDLTKASETEHNTFSLIWNSVVEDFYHRDQLSLSEAEALSYLRIAPDQDSQVDMQFPTVWMPPFMTGPCLDKALRQGPSPTHLPAAPPGLLPPVMLDALKLILWTLHSGGVLDAPELELLVEPLLSPLALVGAAYGKYFGAAQALVHDALAFMSDMCRGHVLDSQLQPALQGFLEASHPELELQVEFSLGLDSTEQGERNGARPGTASTDARLRALGGIAHCMQQSMQAKPDLAAAVRYLAQLSELHEWQDSQPEVEEVEGHLRTFVQLLHHKKLGNKGVCPAACMSPYTTLVPVYKEGVMPCMDEESAAMLMGFRHQPPPPETLDSAKVWMGMITEIEPGVSQLSYIQNLHALEWRNFQCRIAAQTGLVPRDITADKFLPGQPLHEYEWEILTWCAGRSQLLGRQMPALATYYKATATLLALECPCPPTWGVERYYEWLKQATGVKYQAVLSLQIMGQQLFSPEKPKDIWDAKAMIALLNHYPFLRGVYVHDEPLESGGSLQYSVLVQGKYREQVQEGLIQPRGASISLATYPSPSLLTSYLWRPDPATSYRPFSLVDQLTTALQPVYAVRLPRNYYSGRGVVIGSGKPENHNLGIPFVFTDVVQGNDSNMDNLMADALKMRNIVSEHMVADRFARVFIPLLKSQLPHPTKLSSSGLYEVKYVTQHKPGGSQGETSRSPMGLKMPSVGVRPKGLADVWDADGQVKRVVGVVRSGSVAASVYQYSVGSSFGEDDRGQGERGDREENRRVGIGGRGDFRGENRWVNIDQREENVWVNVGGRVEDGKVSLGESTEGREFVVYGQEPGEGEESEGGSSRELESQPTQELERQYAALILGERAEAGGSRSQGRDERTQGMKSPGDSSTGKLMADDFSTSDAETDSSGVNASTHFTTTIQSTEWSDHTSDHINPLSSRSSLKTRSPLKTARSPMKPLSPLQPIPSSPTNQDIPTAPSSPQENPHKTGANLQLTLKEEEVVADLSGSRRGEEPEVVVQPQLDSRSSFSGTESETRWSGQSSSSDGLEDEMKTQVLDVSYRLQQRDSPSSSCVTFSSLSAAMKNAAAGAHLAILGINPWICTKAQGTFAWLNALNENFFTINIQSQLQYNSRIRYHYGLGDVWNKFWAITNSGMSRPCTNLHAVEDLPVGVRVVVKGGVIKLRSYLQVGKCRETHLMGMLGYMYKICSGGYESSLGRDYYLLHARFDPLRQATSWEAITSMVVIFRLWFVSAWVRVQVEMLLILLNLRKDITSGRVPDHFALVPHWFPVRLDVRAWDLGVLLFWTFLLPFLLYASTITLQHGFFRALGEMLRLHTTIWPMVNFIYCKWWDSVAHISGHHQLAQYVSTGRGFGLHHVPFIYKYCVFSHTLWYYAAVVIGTGALLMSDAGYWSGGSVFGSVIAGFLVVMGAMFLLGCFWYTPLSFSVGHVLRDAGDWWGWMHGEVDAYTGASYHQWLRQQLEPWHNLKCTVEDFHLSWLLHTAGLLIRNGILIAFCVHLVYASSETRNVTIQFLGSDLRKEERLTYWDMALVLAGCTAVFWGVLLVLCVGHRLGAATAQASRKPVASMFLTLFGILAALLSLVACYQPFVLPLGNDVPAHLVARNLFAVVAGNVLMLGLLVQMLQLSRWGMVVWVVECVYWGLDLCYGLALQGLLLLLALTPLMQWVQNETISAGAGYSAAMCQTG